MHYSGYIYQATSIMLILIATSPSFLQGRPDGSVAAVMEESSVEAAVAEEIVPPEVVIEAVPEVVSAAVKNAVPVPASSPIQSVPLGGGVITEQKNSDGSVVTVTRFNGPMPANFFPKMQRNFPSPFVGFGYPFGYSGFGLPGAADYRYYF